jgi:energy-coupling factor transporter ATP-binding protein EcfA2
MPVPVIEVNNLSKHYKVPVREAGLKAATKSLFRRKYNTVKAVDSISFTIEPGEVVGFLGPNGAGKTTTLKMLSGLLFPTSGTPKVLGFQPSRRQAEFLGQITLVMGNRSQMSWDLPALEQFPLTFSTHKRDMHSPVHRPNRNPVREQLPRQNTVIVGNTAQLLESRLGLFIHFVGICHFGDHPHHHLRGYVELGTDVFVAKVMQIVLLERLGPPGTLTHKIAGSICRLNRAPECIDLFKGRQQFDLGDQLHTLNYSTYVLFFQYAKSAFLTRFDLSLDRFDADLTTGSHVAAFSPKRGVLPPEWVAHIGKLLLGSGRQDAFEVIHNLSRSKFGRGRDEEPHLIGHDFNRQDFKTLLGGNFVEQIFQTFCNWPNQHFLTIAWCPNKMVVDYIDTGRVTTQLLVHALMLIQRGAPIGGGASSRRSKQRVSAPQKL